MEHLESELAYFRRKIGQAWSTRIAEGQALADGAIAATVTGGPFPLNEEEAAWLIRVLEESFTTTQKRGSAVKASDFKPWLRDRRATIDPYYWDRLRRYYLEGGVIPPQVVATLDAVTDEILEFSGDPEDTGLGLRRGMVLGHVQSGKTTNYSALICKAADAGYRTIILLAGITNSLRAQTQERLDDTFIGKKSVFNAVVQETLPIQAYATAKRFPAYGTSRDRDFTRDAAGVFFSLAAHNEPIIFITKKNKAPLQNLRDWLTEQAHGGTISSPLLLIDDEADNASVNTQADPKATTTINAAIREILRLFDRRTYIGYTATPFANIFIDPDTETEMLGDDLFPKHFIKELDPPSNYVGAGRVFDEAGDLRADMVRVVKDYTGVLPLKHKRDHPLRDLPASLKEAIRVFLLTRAIRVLLEQGDAHCSMMINVSRFNAIQEKVLGLVYAYLEQLRNAITVAAGLGKRATDNAVLALMKDDFEREFADCGFTFAQVLKVLKTAADTVYPVTVNMKGGALDYSLNRERGLHVIAIGGLALSRGLTLEGLTVSYILRNTAASDTLMQMARWFGYRPGFEKICRLYLPQSSLDHYEKIHEAIEELRTEIKRMQVLRLTPEHFGLKVRQSPTAIRITAANKMRTAVKMTVAQDYSARHVEGYVLANSNDTNGDNLKAVRTFVAGLGPPSEDFPKDPAKVWPKVPGADVARLLRDFQFPPSHPDLGLINTASSLFRDYVSDRLTHDLAEWDVAVPHLRTGETRGDLLPGLDLALRTRASGGVDDTGYRVTAGKNRVADRSDARIALTEEQKAAAALESAQEDGLQGDKAFCAQRVRPLLMIHLFETGAGPMEGLEIRGPVVSLSFCMPRTDLRPQARTYQVNAVYRRQLELQNDETDDDEALLAAGE